jgi:ketosteroid isomerase-like protein
MRTISHRVLTAATLILLLAGVAFASGAADVMKPVHQFIDGFNKGDAKSALAACADEAYIIDEFAPYEWHGAGACSTWANDYEADAKKNGITDGVVTIGKPKHVDVSGDHAYVVVPTTYAFKQNGKPTKENNAVLTLTLQKSSSGWRITSWAWSKD